MLLGCIADDFTGATDLANTLSKAGMACVQINGLAGCIKKNAALLSQVDAVIVALKSRSIHADDAVSQSLSALNWLRKQGCQKFFFKYCSTFDSTQKGNIGPVAEALMIALNTDITIACPAAPENGRSVYQGHLFVGEKLLSETGMRNHPITPMTDSNLVRVLAHQSKSRVGLLDCAIVNAGPDAIAKRLQALKTEGYSLVVADAISDEHLRNLATGTKALPLITGGSGLAVGLPTLYRGKGLNGRNDNALQWPKSGPQLVISGSCSEATLGQIAEMKKAAPSWQLDPIELHKDRSSAIARALAFCVKHSTSPSLLYSSVDQDKLKHAQNTLGQENTSALIENAMGEIARKSVDAGVRRLVVAGGETSGAVVSALGLSALAIGPEIAPGVPWTLSLEEPQIALALKSGNFGSPDFFTRAFEVLP